MIEAKLTSLDFGEQHKQAANLCDELKKRLDKNSVLLNDADYFIHEKIDELREIF